MGHMSFYVGPFGAWTTTGLNGPTIFEPGGPDYGEYPVSGPGVFPPGFGPPPSQVRPPMPPPPPTIGDVWPQPESPQVRPPMPPLPPPRPPVAPPQYPVIDGPMIYDPPPDFRPRTDHEFNVMQREKTKTRLAQDRAKTKKHYAKLRAKGASPKTIAKAKAKSKARGAKIKGQSLRRTTIKN